MLKLMGQGPQDDFIDIVPTSTRKAPTKFLIGLKWFVGVNLVLASTGFWIIVISAMINTL